MKCRKNSLFLTANAGSKWEHQTSDKTAARSWVTSLAGPPQGNNAVPPYLY